jgi:hypothetical protein
MEFTNSHYLQNQIALKLVHMNRLSAVGIFELHFSDHFEPCACQKTATEDDSNLVNSQNPGRQKTAGKSIVHG